MIWDSVTRDRLDLSGTWQLKFGQDGRTHEVQVPSLWNLTHPDAEGPGYYRRAVDLPQHWSGRIVQLHVGGASYRTEAWLNGQYIGSHEGAYTAFRFDVTAAVRFGEANELTLRVTSLSRTRAIDGMVLKAMPVSKQSWYYAEGGLWGDVWFEAVPTLRCESIAIEPDLRQERARVEVTVVNAESETRAVELSVTMSDPTGDVVAEWSESTVVPPGSPTYLVEFKIPRPLPWSCEQPNLYRVRAVLREGERELDAVASTFGMRDFTVQGGRFLLNGEPVYLRGVLLQPNYPVGLIAPTDPGLMEREVLLAKEAGFNLIRIHIRPSVPGFFDLTDRHGMLVYAESSLCWILDTPRLLDHGRREVTAMIERDRNHPSVVFWGIFNEHRAPAARYAEALVRAARALDPTRVIVDNSGGTLAMDQDFGWADRATVVPNRETTRVPVHDVHLYIGAPVTRAACEWLRTLGTAQQAVNINDLGFGSPAIFDEWYRELRIDPSQILVSELGCGGMADLDELVAGFGGRHDLLDAREFVAFRDSLHEGFAARGLDRIFGSTRELALAAQRQQADGNRRQIEAVLANPRTSGYILTQLNDVGAEFHAGIVDLWRRPKTTFGDLKRVNHERCLVLVGARTVVTCGEAVEVTLTVVDRVSAGGQVTLMVCDPNGARIAEEVLAIPPGQGIKELGSITVQTGTVAGEHRVVASVVGDRDSLMTTGEVVLALPGVDWSAIPSGVMWLGEHPEVGGLSPLPPEGSADVVAAARPATLTSEDWAALFFAVEAGATGVIGALRPADETAIRVLAERGVNVQLHFGIGNWMGCYHWQPASDLFAGLPAGGLAGEAYADVLPRYILSELGGTLLAGSFRNTETRHDVPKMLWFGDVEVIDRGQGRLILCQYRVFDRAECDPLAGRMLLNLLRLAGQPSPPAPLPMLGEGSVFIGTAPPAVPPLPGLGRVPSGWRVRG